MKPIKDQIIITHCKQWDIIKIIRHMPSLMDIIKGIKWGMEEERGSILPSYEATPDEHWADDTEEELNGLAISADGTIYIGGTFVNPPISNDEYWARWNGMRFEPIAFEGLDI